MSNLSPQRDGLSGEQLRAYNALVDAARAKEHENLRLRRKVRELLERQGGGESALAELEFELELADVEEQALVLSDGSNGNSSGLPACFAACRGS